MLKTK